MSKKRFGMMTSLALLCLSSCGNVTHDITEYVLELEYKTDFKILQLNDIHLANKDDQQRQFDFLDLTVKDADADLIVLCGDSFTFADKITARRLFDWLDSHETPWTMTFGNHDEQTYFSIDWLTGELNKRNEKRTNNQGSYCVFKDIQDDDVFGNANFAINLVKNNEIMDQIILLDSNRYCFGDYWGYDAIHDNQIEWYKTLVDYTTIKAGHVVTSFAYFHIPLPETQIAYDLALEEQETGVDNPDVELVIGNKDNLVPEPCSCPKVNTGLFDVILEKGSTKAIFNAHDHIDNYATKYKGILLSYGVNSTDRIYFEEEIIGGQVLTIHEDSTFDITQIFHTYEEVNK